MQLYADGFDKLTLTEKTLVWHLYQAALAGRDIYYDQRHRHNLGIRHLLEQILRHSNGIPAETLDELTRYTKLFWLNTGPYNNLTARKFLLDLDRRRLIEAMEIAAINGARLRSRARARRSRNASSATRAMFFDPDFEPMVTCKTPGDGQDILASSANNLYDGVTMADLEGFEEQQSAELAPRQARRPARRRGLQGRRPLRSRDSQHRRRTCRTPCRLRRSRLRRR